MQEALGLSSSTAQTGSGGDACTLSTQEAMEEKANLGYTGLHLKNQQASKSINQSILHEAHLHPSCDPCDWSLWD